MIRLSDNDKKFGPLVVAKNQSNFRPIRAVYSSGDCEECDGGGLIDSNNSLTVYAFGYIFHLSLPKLIKSYKVKVVPNWDHETINRLGRNYYFDVSPREYGFCLSDGYLQFFYGRKTDDSTTDKSVGYFLPWTQWRLVSTKIFDKNRNCYFIDETQHDFMESFEISLQIKEQIEKNKFQIEDFDGKLITVKTYFEERTYKLGTGLFKWVSWFKHDNVVKNLEMQFDSELGPDKKSWKGGIVATAIEYYHLEDQISAFRRFCDIEHYARNGKFKVKFLQEIKD